MPELPPPVAAVEPPESQRFSSNSNISRSGSNQFTQNNHVPERYNSQPVVSPVHEESVSSSQVYHLPSDEPDSNPFMNGDDEIDE